MNPKNFKFIGLAAVVILPIFFLVSFDLEEANNCCTDSAVFSPEHRVGIYSLIAVSMVAYSISIFRKQLFPPIIELLTNIFLIMGLIINLLLCFHIYNKEFGAFFLPIGSVPIIMLFFIQLYDNHLLLKTYINENEIEADGFLGQLCFSILKLDPFEKYSILLILALPVLVLISVFLLIFGQKPDSLIRAFTDTYKHGFSQLDYMCDNVQCGGHFLCSVGANGHKNIVKPVRYGERKGKKIICTRQLLISNAFEDLLQEKRPATHKILRQNYNRVGHFVHRYYSVFNIKLVSDFVYILMKPLEWFFLLAIYTFDQKPENRIAIQYLSKKDRQLISNSVSEVEADRKRC